MPVRRLLGMLGIGATDGGAESKIRDWRPSTYRVVATDLPPVLVPIPKLERRRVRAVLA